MISAKLVSVLKSFSHEETREFEKFLLSPFFNTNKSYVKFYKGLLKFHPDYKSELLTSENIYGRMFAGKPYSKQTMWNLSSGLEKLAEEFLTQLSLIKKPLEKFNLIIDEFRMRLLGRHFNKKLSEWEKMTDIYKIDIDQLYNLALLEENKVSYWQQIKGISGKQTDNYFELAQIYTLYYLITISRIINSIITGRTFSGFSGHSSMAEDFVRNINFDKFIEISKKNNYKYSDLIEFYYNIIYCDLNPENEKYYFNARKFLFKNHALFSYKEKKDLTSNLANYCTEKNRLGYSNFYRELFNINKFRLEHGVAIYFNGTIGKILYKQIVINASSLMEIQWAEKFVEKYTPLLHEEHRESMKKLAMAYIYFNTKKYGEVLDSLSKFKSADMNDKIAVKNLIARSYYEMKEFELLLYHIDSAKHFIKSNKKIGNYLREINGNFFNYLHSIVTEAEQKDEYKVRILKQNISKDNMVNHKNWLLEKLAELQ